MPRLPWDDEVLRVKRPIYREALDAMFRSEWSVNATVKTVLPWILIVVLGFLLWTILRPQKVQPVAFGHVAELLQRRQVQTWRLADGAITVTTRDGARFRAHLPAAEQDRLWRSLVASGAPMATAIEWSWTSVMPVVATALVLIIGVWMAGRLSLQRTRRSPLEALSLSRAVVTQFSKKLTFKDFVGDAVKVELHEYIEFFREPQRLTKLGGKMPKGMLFIGPPGSGKKTAVRAMSGEANVPVFLCSGADFAEMFPGVGAKRVRDVFVLAHKNAPAIVVIEHLDAVGRRRSAAPDPLAFEQEIALSQLLLEVDSADSKDGVLVIATTDRPDLLDEALVAPGRFDRIIEFGQLTIAEVEQFLRLLTRNIPLAEDVDLQELAAQFNARFSNTANAAISAFVNDAAVNAARYDKKKVQQVDFDFVLDQYEQRRVTPPPQAST